MWRLILPVWRGAVEAGLGHICHIGVTAITKVVEEVLPVAFWVTYAVALLAFRAAAPVARHAVTGIKSCQGMVTFWITLIIANLADITVGEYQAVPQGGVGHIMNAELPGNIVEVKRFIEMLVLQNYLVVWYSWPFSCIVPDINDTISHFLWPAERPQMVVMFNDFNVVAHSLATTRRLQRCVQNSFSISNSVTDQKALSSAQFCLRLRETTVFYCKPLAPRVLKRFADDKLR